MAESHDKPKPSVVDDPVPLPEDEYRLDRDRIQAEIEEARRTPLPWHQRHAAAPDSTHEDDNAWVFIYLDVLTLLLTMFVVLLAYAKTDAERYRELSEAVSKEMGHVEQPLAKPESPEERLMRQLVEALGQQGMLENAEVLLEDGGVELRMKERVLFSTGEAELKAAGRAVLARVVPVLQQGGHAITVEGHTDDVPISNERFPSNWELSSARASTVVRYLIDQGITAPRLRAIGYADTRPLADNAQAEGRASNRRVSLMITMQGEGSGSARP